MLRRDSLQRPAVFRMATPVGCRLGMAPEDRYGDVRVIAATSSDLSELLRYIVLSPSVHPLEPHHSLIANPLIRKGEALFCPQMPGVDLPLHIHIKEMCIGRRDRGGVGV